MPGQPAIGGSDAFVARYDAAGGTVWTYQFGTAGSEVAVGVAVNAGGETYVVGATDGTLPGQTRAGAVDAFVVKLAPPR
jgi:hypothetical protein